MEKMRSTVFNLMFKLKATLRLPPDPFDVLDSSEYQTQSSQSSTNTTGGGAVQETANLFREFSIFTADNRYLILAGSQPTPDESLRASDVFRNNETTRVPLSINLEDFELFCIDIEKGICTDTKKFKMDKINMRHNEGVSLHNRILAVLSIFHQTIHLYHLTDDGHFVELQRIGQFLNEHDALNWRRYCLDHEKNYGSSTTKDHTYSSLFDTFNSPLKQQLLSSLYKLTYQNGADEPWTAEKRVNACRKFYKRFSVFERMKIYRMRLIDEENIFIRFVDEELLTRHIQEDDDVSFFVFYNIPKNEILAVYENNDPVCLSIFEKFVDCFRYGMPPGEKFLKLNDEEPSSPEPNDIRLKFNLPSLSSRNSESMFLYYDRFSSTISYSLYANKQYNEFKRSLEEKLCGRIGDLCKCILNQLPHFEQSFSSSPYFDPELFICDPRRLSAYDRPKSYDDLPVRVRDPKTGALRFQLKCMSYRSSSSPREPNKNLAIYIFHPYEPFAISMQRTGRTYCMNFHYYNAFLPA
uniref:Uncharacterized protein n=1 Tax=Romanomermis culicivorax TaxID=13658 RepID=A0A915HPV1_ROMCU